MNEKKELVKKLAREGQLEFLKNVATMLTSAFGLVAALAWNEFVKDLIGRYIAPGSGLLSRFIYALFVTILAVLVTWQLGKIAKELVEKKDLS